MVVLRTGPHFLFRLFGITSLLLYISILTSFTTHNKIEDFFVDSFSITSQCAASSQQVVWSSFNQNPKSHKQKQKGRQQRRTKEIPGLNLYPKSVSDDNHRWSDTRYKPEITLIQNRRSPRCQHRVSSQVGIQPLYTTMHPLTDNSIKKESAAVSSSSSPAFIIDSLSKSSIVGDAIFQKISDLCIDVFFKELLDPSGNGNINFVKEWQIGYLKNLQAADLRRRRERCRNANEMFLAYEVKRVTEMATVLSKPLLLDDELGKVFNLKRILDGGHGDGNYVRGDLIGFVEITQRPYGLGSSLESSSILSSSEIAAAEFNNPFGERINDRPLRPVLTNLAVLKGARRYGIGTKLVNMCENHVRQKWDMNEIVLEVEDYNTKGLEFYRRRGFDVLFSDPASKRYDIDSGLWLKKVRCRREVMRKVYNDRQLSLKETADNLVRRIRESVENF